MTALGRQSLEDLLDIINNEDAVCIMSLFRRSVFERIGGFNLDLADCEDYEYWVRAAYAGLQVFLNPQPLAYYRRRPESKSAHEIGHATCVVQTYRALRTLCRNRPVELAAINRQLTRFEREWLFIAAKTHLVRGEFEAASADFTRLSAVSNDLTSAIMAGVSRRLPHALLWAYRAKSAWRMLRRTPLRS